ncbi:MAG: Gfo/Idh/MocA family protein [Alphaproteobacteria bacterium]
MDRMRVAMVGLGMAVTPHARSLMDVADRVEVAYAYAPSAERRRSFAARFPFPTVDSLDPILADPSVAAVLLLTPPNTHLDLARRIAAAGKHLLMEKPLEVSPARAEALVRDCRAAGIRLGIVFQHRFRPSGDRLRALIAEGRLGRPVGASAFVNLWRPQSYYDEPGRGTLARDGGGVLLTQAIHTIDQFLSYAGMPAEVTGYAVTSPVHRMETEDTVAASLRFATGAIGNLGASTAAYPGFAERIELIGTLGTAVIDGTALHARFQDGTEVQAGDGDESDGWTGADPMAFGHDMHRALIVDFLDAVRDGRDPRVTGEAALNAHRLIAAILHSAAEGRPVRLAGS